MDFFQRLGNWLGGKGWINDEEKRRKEQQVTPVTPQPPQSQSQTHQSVRPSQPQHSFLQNRQGYQRQTQTKLPTQQTATQVANTSAMETRRHPRFDWNEPKPQATSNPYKPRVAPTQDEADRMPKMLSPEGQQEWIKKDRAQKRIEEDIRRKQQEQAKPKKPGFLDFLNPFGEHGIFGAKQQKLVKETIEKPVVGAMKSYENWVDSSDKQQGFQWNDLGDYLRFAAKLPSGMVTGLAEAPNKIANTITGKRVTDDGKVENLNLAQRFGTGLDAGISIGGLTFGGSGTLIRSITSQGAKQAAKQGLKQTVVNGAKNLAKDAAKEGLEEGVQTFAQDLSDDGRINTDWRNYRDAVAMGALGGSMMHGAGKGVDAVRNVYREGNLNPVQAIQNKYQIRNAYKVVDGDRPTAKITPRDDLPVLYTKDAHQRLLEKHPEDGSRQFIENMDHLRTLQRPDVRIDRTYRDKTYLKEGVNDLGDLGKTSIKPIPEDNQSYINTAYVISDDKKIAKELAGNHGVPAPGSETTAVKNSTFDGQTGADVDTTVAKTGDNVNDGQLSPNSPATGIPRKPKELSAAEQKLYNIAKDSRHDQDFLARVYGDSDGTLLDVLEGMFPETKRDSEWAARKLMSGEVPVELDFTRPFIMLHGSPSRFKSFDPRMSNSASKTGVVEGAVSLTSSINTAKSYGENVYSVAVNIKNPLVIDAKGSPWNEISYDGQMVTVNDIAQQAKSSGHDALVVLNSRDTGALSNGRPGGFETSDTVHVFDVDNIEVLNSDTSGPTTDSDVEGETSTGGSREEGEMNDNQATEQSSDSNRYAQEMAQAQETARKGEKPTLRERWQDFKEDMREKFVDRFAPIEDKIVNEAERLEMRNSLDRVLRADGIAEAFVRDNHLDEVIHSFANKREMQMFDQALIAKHAIELEKNGVTTGRDVAKDKALVNEAEKLFAPQFAQVRNYSNRMLQQTVDYGLISQETADYLRQKYPEYVPFDRIFSESELDARSGRGRIEGEASLSRQDIVQRIKGSTRQIDSPLNALVMKTQAMVQQGERNVTAKMLASYADDPKNPFQLRELEAGEQVNGRPTISYLDAGTRRTFIAAPEVARAAKNMNREQMGIILRAIAVPARILRMGATGVNAGFTMANVVKDYVGATINSKNSISAMNPKTFVDALEAAFHHKGDTYLDMQRAGVLGNSYEIARNASQLNLAEIRSHRNFWTRAAHNLKSPLKTLENTIGRSEDFGRAMQFISNKKAAMRQGMSEADAIKFAADQARWNSTNFMRHGTYGKAINAIAPYSNAGIQGQRIMMRRFKENPKRYTAKVMIGVVAPTAAALAYSYASDDGKEVMKNLPDYVKENNVVIVSPGATYDKEQNRWNGVYLIPVPPQYLPLHRQVHAATKHVMTGQGIDVGKSIGDAIEQVTTVNPTEMHRTAAQYTPQVAKPFVENFANKNLFTGQQIVPDGMKNLEAKDQWDNNTSLTARKLGEAMGVSPKKIDNFFRTSTAGGGQNLLYGTDWAIAKATGASDDEIKGRSLMDSIVGRFYGPKGTSQGSYYYESLEKSAKDNKLVGNDLEFFQALTTRKFNENGRAEGKTDAEAMRNSRVLADTPNVAKAISDAAKWRAAQTGEELDPLYKLPLEHQRYYYHIQGSAKNGAEQRDLENKAPWLRDLRKARSAYFKRQDVKSENSKRIPYPEASPELEAIQDKYYSMPKGPEKWAFLDAHPELTEHWARVEEYGNKVREAQGYAPRRTRPQPSEYVKMQMANKNWRDPAVSKYLQDMNIYNITNSASLAEMQGNELDPKALKAIQNLGKYGLVKNPDGTFALKNVDEQGTGVSNIQPGAYDPGVRSWGGYRRRGGSGGAVVAARSNEASKVANSTAMSLSSLAKNRPQLRNVQFTARAADLRQFMRGRNAGKPRKSRAVTFH